MLASLASSVGFLFLANWVCASPAPGAAGDGTPAARVVQSVTLNGQTFVNKGLVGFGLIPSDFRESTGDTLGGIGSAMDIKYGSFKASNGKFQGTFVVSPDRGFNINGTIDYQSRHHEIDFTLTPYYDTANLSFVAAQNTLSLRYRKTILNSERENKKTSGLTPLAVRKEQSRSSTKAFLDPEMPIASIAEPHLSVDAEGLVSNPDGTFWLSDEYGPYIYRFSSDGKLIQTIQPPNAFLPRDASGALNFSSEAVPKTGRNGNQGFENLTLDHKNQILYAMLQSATIQDGGDSKSTSRYTRLVAYDVSHPLLRPKLVGEWVVPLPQSSKGNTQASSEIHFVSPGVFLALARDGDGRGGGDDNSGYKQADLFSIVGATDIHGTKFDDPAHPIATGGVLDPSIKPATYVPFINYLDPAELARLGLHNGIPNDQTLIDAKWESFALGSVNEADHPDDYFLFTASDNDFLSTKGVALGVPFDGGLDVDNQFMVFRVTLPGATKARQGL
ncbi:esterase-like activity of phytase-domain-containing protein [Lyophyllum atratum]|nr:esterase-like activity of phytase-domain-containing protein [Lyophyllum atratum]